MCNLANCQHKKMVQLHLHTDGSLLDGVTNYKKVIAKAKEYGHPAIAITDHGNPCRIFDFYKEAKKQGIKPLLGLEFYITNDLRQRKSHKERTDIEDYDYHQSVYIKNKQGYLNYNHLTYISYTDGYYYKPRIDFDVLFEKKEGLIITSSCMASKIGNYVRENRHKEAEALFKRYAIEFGEDFYGEIQFNEVGGQKEINDFIIHACRKYDIPMIIGGDVHYTDPSDNFVQDAVIRSKRDSDAEDWVISARKLFYHDTNNYYEFNKELGWNYDEKMLEQCFENSIKFADKVNFEFETGVYHLPKIDTHGMTSQEYIEKVAWEGVAKNIELERKYFPNKYTNKDIEKIEQQIEYELKVINDMGLNDYLLLVYEIIKWEKENGYYVGPGRGSAAGSTTAWGLGITALNPLEHGLLFERFINPNRKTMADIDWDSEMGAREKILEYLIGKFGRDSVVNVPTFGTYGPKSGLQAMSRGLRKDTGQDSILMRKITKIPKIADENPATKWKPKPGEMISFFKEYREKTTDADIIAWIDNNEDTIDYADRLQGQLTNLGTHAGGIVVTPGPVYNYIPVTKSTNNLVAAFKEADGSSKDLSDLGVLKLDALGLKGLNLLKECVTKIKEDTGVDLSEKIYYLPLDDKKMIEAFETGKNYGIFQMDRSDMFVSTFRKDGGPVDCFEDIVVINAMNRPGPLEKYLGKYGYWKGVDRGWIEVTDEEREAMDKERYPFEFMRSALSNTHGCLLYQEQFMNLVCEVTGMSFGDADSFRRAIGWTKDNPKYYTVAGYFERLENAMLEKGYTKNDVEAFVKYCRDFMGYSFNRSHSVCYAYVAWQMLYFKTYYPAYFYSAMINLAGNIDEIQTIISDARMNDIKILTQSVKESEYMTRATDTHTLRLGFGMLKGMGDSTIQVLNSFKNYSSIDELLKQKLKGINSTQFQNLVDIGAFDDYGIDRSMISWLRDLYQDEKIKDWFTRKRQPLRVETCPETLKRKFDAEECVKIALEAKKEAPDPFFDEVTEDSKEPWDILLSKLLSTLKVNELDKDKYSKDTAKKQTELMGFSLVESPLGKLETSLKIKGLLPITEYEDPTKKYYFVIEKIEKAVTQTGKTYLKLSLNNGIKAKCWREINVEENEVYYGVFKKDTYGMTLNDREVYKAV